jgi:hypothetical protein
MKYKTALGAVFAKYRNPRTRTHAVSLLERYASTTRPVTAWHALGEDAEAARLLLETLGFREKEHFTVQASVLDPSAVRFSWTDDGVRLIAVLASELREWDGSLVQRRVLTPGPLDPLELVPDVDTPEPDAAAESSGFTSKVLEMTKAVAGYLKASAPATDRVDSTSRDGAVGWALLQDSQDDCEKTPMAPLAVLEVLARMRGNVPDMPPFQVFDVYDARSAVYGWQASRPVKLDEEVPAGRINMIPLADQKGSCGQLDGYFAWSVADWRKFPEDRVAVWTQFDARLVRKAEVLQFALDAEKMRAFTCAIVEAAYPGLSCGLVSATRLAVGNTALGGAPGNENLETDDGDTSSFQYRLEDSAFPVDAPVYMGAYLLARGHVGDGMWVSTPTHPVKLATGDPDKDAGANAMRADEIADEWFVIVHGGVEDEWDHQVATWRSADDRRRRMESNLARYRAFVARNLYGRPGRVLDACAPTNPEFNRLGGSDDEGGFSAQGAFVNGIAAAMRKYAPDAIRFVENSPHFPDKIFAGVWSGIAADLAPVDVWEAGEAGVFPNLGPVVNWFSGYRDQADVAPYADAFVELMRRNPHVQLRFGKRTSGVPRGHVVVIETNVAARPFVEAVSGKEPGKSFDYAVWRAFYSAFLARRTDPLASLDEGFSAFGNTAYTLSGFREWVSAECPEWADLVKLDRYSTEPHPGFRVGWLEDSKGRLLLVVSSSSAEMSLRIKAAWRYASELPVPSASYLAKAGRTSTVALTDRMSDDERYRAVLRAAMNQEKFLHDCMVTNGCRGKFGTAWILDSVWNMDSDELPDRGWYMVPGAMELVHAYVVPS